MSHSTAASMVVKGLIFKPSPCTPPITGKIIVFGSSQTTASLKALKTLFDFRYFISCWNPSMSIFRSQWDKSFITPFTLSSRIFNDNKYCQESIISLTSTFPENFLTNTHSGYCSCLINSIINATNPLQNY